MNNINQPIFDKMLNDPLGFTSVDFDHLIHSYQTSSGKYNVSDAFKDFRKCIQHIYDLNDDRLLETSNANTGHLGRLNRRSTKLRQKEYFKRVENQQTGKRYVRIYAEGDSWFLFPTFVKDIIDWLEMNEEYLIYSDAYGGDWITNIIYEGQYIEALTIHSPDVFLLSGGGNDLVGNERMAVMVSRQADQQPKYTVQSMIEDPKDEHKQLIFNVQKYINKEFYAFIWTMKAQYTMLFKGLYENTDKFKKMITITHGYAYPYPHKGNNFSLKYPLQPIVNSFLNSGQWLFRPLMMKGILDPQLQRGIVMTFIYEYNQMIGDLAAAFDNVFYINCRNIPTSKDDWYDELHLKSHKFKEVADLFKKTINEHALKLGQLKNPVTPVP